MQRIKRFYSDCPICIEMNPPAVEHAHFLNDDDSIDESKRVLAAYQVQNLLDADAAELVE